MSSLDRLLVLNDLGFSLTEITRIIEEGVTNDELIGRLRLRRAKAETKATENSAH